MDREASATDVTFAFDHFLPYRLSRVADMVNAHFLTQAGRLFELSWPEWRVVDMLGSRGIATARDIVGQSGLHKTKISRAVGLLEQRDWLLRITDREDRRVERLELTPLGRTHYARLIDMARTYQDMLTALIGAVDMRMLGEALSNLEETIAAGDLEAVPPREGKPGD